jgi:hypothetical protein
MAYPNQKNPMPNKPAKKLFPGRLDKANPTKKHIIKGVYHGKNKVSMELSMRMVNNFTKNINSIFKC